MTAVSPECGWAGTCTGDPIPGSSWCHRHTMVDRFSAHLNPPPPTVAEVEAALVHRFHGDTAPDDGGCWHCREAATLLTAIYRDMGGVTLVVRESDKAAARGALAEFRRTHGGAA